MAASQLVGRYAASNPGRTSLVSLVAGSGSNYQNRVPHQALEVPKLWEAARISTNFYVVISANIFAKFLPLGWPLGTYVPLSPHGLLDR